VKVQPFGASIGVVDPPRERVRDSGLIVISNEIEVDEGICSVNPGLSDDGADQYGLGPTPLRVIHLGALVWYVKGSGVRIGDVNIINIKSIIAYDNEEFGS
jgi:hypothetical protein